MPDVAQLADRLAGALVELQRAVARAVPVAMAPVPTPTVIDRTAERAASAAPMPGFVYRAIGDAGWRLEARRNGLPQRALRARPLDPKPSEP